MRRQRGLINALGSEAKSARVTVLLRGLLHAALLQMETQW